MNKRSKCVILCGHTPTEYEECTAEEWDRTKETMREFINFKDGRGFVFARPTTPQK